MLETIQSKIYQNNKNSKNKKMSTQMLYLEKYLWRMRRNEYFFLNKTNKTYYFLPVYLPCRKSCQRFRQKEWNIRQKLWPIQNQKLWHRTNFLLDLLTCKRVLKRKSNWFSELIETFKNKVQHLFLIINSCSLKTKGTSEETTVSSTGEAYMPPLSWDAGSRQLPLFHS